MHHRLHLALVPALLLCCLRLLVLCCVRIGMGSVRVPAGPSNLGWAFLHRDALGLRLGCWLCLGEGDDQHSLVQGGTDTIFTDAVRQRE